MATSAFRAFGFGDDRRLRLEYERTAVLTGDRMPEFLNVELTDLEPGAYRVRLDIRETRDGDRTFTERLIHIVGREE